MESCRGVLAGVKHPGRVRSIVLCGMGWFREGSAQALVWKLLSDTGSGLGAPAACVRSLGALAVSEADVKAVRVPAAMVVGDRDPVMGLYVLPLCKVRADWPLSTIAGAGHLNCVVSGSFKSELKKRLDENAGKRE